MKFSGKGLFTVFLVGSAALSVAQAGPVVWTAPSMHRVGMSEAAGSGAEVSLTAARGEYESFQIVTNGAGKGLGNVNVTVSDLQGPAGQDHPENQFHSLSRKIHARNWIQSQLEGIQPAARSWLVSRCAYSFHRSGNRQTHLRRASGERFRST